MKDTRKNRLLGCASLIAMATQLPAAALGSPPQLASNDGHTTTPIKHVIVIYAENRSFDHLFATYTSPSGDKVLNNETTHEGATAMGFYNVQQGDIPYFKLLADHYRMSDNYH